MGDIFTLVVAADSTDGYNEELGIEPLELSLRSRIGKIVSAERLEDVPEVISDLYSRQDKLQQISFQTEG
jgi:hypothetical protein